MFLHSKSLSTTNTTIFHNFMTADLLYVKFRCQEWITFFIFFFWEFPDLHRVPMYLSRHITSLPTSLTVYLSVTNLENSENVGQEPFLAVQRPLFDWQLSQSPGAQRQKKRHQRTAVSAAEWVEKRGKCFHHGDKQQCIYSKVRLPVYIYRLHVLMKQPADRDPLLIC